MAILQAGIYRGAEMRTFIEQKADVQAEILTLERENESLFNKIDQNEFKIKELERLLNEIGNPSKING